MRISRLFEVSPFLALSFLVCMGTVLWCIILLRRGCHHVADRFLIGFIGLLTIYHSVQILRRGGVFSIPNLGHFDEAVDLLVNALYLIAALLLLIPPGIMSARAWAFEYNRWQQSDYPSGSSGGNFKWGNYDGE